MKLAFLFPGQGTTGMLECLELATASVFGREMLAHAASEAGVAVAALAEREGRALERTEVLQPVLVAACLALHRRLDEAGLQPVALAGHSVGELSAFGAAGALSARDAVSVAAVRGRAMAREAARCPGGLVALSSGDEAVVQAALEAGRAKGSLEVAARNAADEVVLSGDEAALREVVARFPSRRLNVAGAWHGPGMRGAEAEYRAALEARATGALRTPVVANADGAAVESSGAMAGLLSGQLTRPVEWRQSLLTLGKLGVTDYVTVGPGAVLRALVRRNPEVKSARVHGTAGEAELGRTLSELRGVA